MVLRSSSRPAARRLVVVLSVLLMAGVGWAAGRRVARRRGAEPVPEADCGPGSRPETSIQGRVPKADYDSGRAERGYLCNTRQVAHQGASGGFKTLRYTDRKGNTCALLRLHAAGRTRRRGQPAVRRRARRRRAGHERPGKPRRTDTLVTPTMLSPHESLLVNSSAGCWSLRWALPRPCPASSRSTT